MTKKERRVIKLNSLIVALSLMANPLASTISNGFGMQDGANLIVLIAICLVYLIRIGTEGLNIRSMINGISKITLFIVMEIFILYILTGIFKPHETNYSFVQLVFYAIVPIIAISFKFDTDCVLRYSLYLSVLTVFGIDSMLSIRWEGYEQADLGHVYSLIAIAICFLFHWKYYGKESGWYMKLIYIYDIYILVRVFMVANRGAILSILFTVLVIFLYDFDDKGIMKSNTFKKYAVLVSISIAAIIIMQNLLPILEGLRDFCRNTFQSVPAFIPKMIRYIKADDIGNGRSDINQVLFRAFKESPLFGHGLETFPYYTRMNAEKSFPYPHNYIYQYMFEGGILFAAVPVFFSLEGLVVALTGRVKLKEKYVMLAMLVCQCFPKLLVSSDVWKGTAIWMLIVYTACSIGLINKRLTIK